METFNNLKNLVLAAEADASKFFEKGNMSAGTRLRKHLSDVRKMATDLRKEVSEIKNAQKAEA